MGVASCRIFSGRALRANEPYQIKFSGSAPATMSKTRYSSDGTCLTKLQELVRHSLGTNQASLMSNSSVMSVDQCIIGL